MSSKMQTSMSERDFERNNVYISLKRTLIPVLVGAVLSGLTAAGLELDPTAVGSVLTGLFSSVYYLAARWLESKNPTFGKFLLGNDSAPVYLEKPKNEA